METVPQRSCVHWLHFFSHVTFHFAKLRFRGKGEKSVRSCSFCTGTNYTHNNLLKKLEDQKILNWLRLPEKVATCCVM